MKVLKITVAALLLSGSAALELRADNRPAATPVPVAVPVNPADKQVLKTQIQDLESQIKSIRGEIQQFNAKKSALWDQVGLIRNQKHVLDLQHRLDDLMGKLAVAQAKSNTVKVTELQTRETTLQREISLQQDIASLLPKLQAAHAGSDTATAKTISDQINADRDSLKALYPPKPAGPTPVVTIVPVGAIPKPTAVPKPEDPEIQTLLDQIHALEDQVKQDQAKIQALQLQVVALRQQMKAMKK